MSDTHHCTEYVFTYGLGLSEADVVVGGTLQIVLIANVVLDGSADEPDGTLRLGQETVTTVDGDLTVAVNVVISKPNPGALDAKLIRGSAREATNIPQSMRRKRESSVCRGSL